MVGTTLGAYRIDEEIGRGGMGQVYRAHDTTLNRTVAVKVLPDGLASDPDRLARFEREAQALAALNHPNIAHIYGLEKSGPTPAIVMEFVGGDDLSARIGRGPVPVAEALPLARQLAEALAAAHEAGIMHRDLKPANIKVTGDGTVKVLDFGLAKALDPSTTPGTTEAANSPTLTNRATQLGIILGTAAYMAPEQARGKAVDKRADIWAFGVVLYEMLTGTRPFDGDDVTDVLAAVVRADPDWATLPKDTPPLIRRLLQRCLTKDPKQRLHDIADARLEIEETLARQDDGRVQGTNAPVLAGRNPLQLVAAVLFAGLAALGGATVAWYAKGERSQGVARVSIDVRPAEAVDAGGVVGWVAPAAGARTAIAWSPDGKSLAFVGTEADARRIFVRDLDKDMARRIDGTDGAWCLAFSPDGARLAFAVSGALRRVAVAGGPVEDVAKIGSAISGISWGETGLLYATASGLFWISPGADAPRRLTDPLGAYQRHSVPHLLPGGRAVVFTESGKRWTSGDERILAMSLPDGSPREVLRQAADARYLASGHLVFLRQGTLYAVGFDLDSLATRGVPVPLLEGVAQASFTNNSADLTLAGQFAISSAGMLAYVSSGPRRDLELVAVDRAGGVKPLESTFSFAAPLALNPDESRVAVVKNNGVERRLFIFERRRGVLSPIAQSVKGEVSAPAWSRDDRVAFYVLDQGKESFVVSEIDGASPPVVVESTFFPNAWSSDGRELLGSQGGAVWAYSLAGPKLEGRPVVDLKGYNDRCPVVSPNGRWLAYVSNRSGRYEVWVQEYVTSGKAVRVSTRGGGSPAWNPSGRELFYVEMDGEREVRFMSVDMNSPLQPGTPTELFPLSGKGLRMDCLQTTCYAVASQGREFITTRFPPMAPPVTQVNIVFGWVEDLRARLAAAR